MSLRTFAALLLIAGAGLSCRSTKRDSGPANMGAGTSRAGVQPTSGGLAHLRAEALRHVETGRADPGELSGLTRAWRECLRRRILAGEPHAAFSGRVVASELAVVFDSILDDYAHSETAQLRGGDPHQTTSELALATYAEYLRMLVHSYGRDVPRIAPAMSPLVPHRLVLKWKEMLHSRLSSTCPEELEMSVRCVRVERLIRNVELLAAEWGCMERSEWAELKQVTREIRSRLSDAEAVGLLMRTPGTAGAAFEVCGSQDGETDSQPAAFELACELIWTALHTPEHPMFDDLTREGNPDDQWLAYRAYLFDDEEKDERDIVQALARALGDAASEQKRIGR